MDYEKSSFENRLQREISKIDAQIKSLQQEKRALERQFLKARAENADLKDVSRINSLDRILVENRIVEALQEKQKPMRSKELYKSALNVVDQIKENTFRTYLHRMKRKGRIISVQRGVWTLPDAHD